MKKPPYKRLNDFNSRLVDEAVANGMEYDPMLQKTLKTLSAFEEIDPEMLKLLQKKIQTTSQENKLQWKTPYPFKPYPTQEELNGYMKLAKIKVADADKKFVSQMDWRVNPYDTLSGILLGGKPKTGKSTFIFKLIFTLMDYINKFDLDTSIWIFDNKKDYSCLVRYFPEAIVIDSSNIFINFLEYNEAVTRQKWINNFTEVFCNTLNVWEGSSNLLSSAIEELFQIYSGSNSNPTIHDLIKYLAQRKHGKSSRVNEYRGSITNRIEGILSSTGKILHVSQGLDFEETLANKKLVIFSLHDLKPESQAMFTLIPILRTFNYRIAKEQRFNYPRNIIIADEAKRIFSKRSEFSHTGASVCTKIFLESREFGFSFILGDHQVSELNSAVQNAYTRVMFRLSDYTIPEVAKNLYLTREQAEYFFHLKQGNAIVRYDRFPYPFVIETEDMMKRIDKNISQEEIEKRMKPVWEELNKNVQPARPEILEEYFRNKGKKGSIISQAGKQGPLFFDLDSANILKHAFENPFLSVTEHYKSIGFSISKGNKAVTTLEEKGLIKKLRIKTKRGRGNLSTFLEVTQDGIDFLGRKSRPYGNKGSLKHALLCRLVEKFYNSKGYQTKKEYLNCDVAVKLPEGMIAVETSNFTSNLEQNLSRNLENGFTKTIFVFETKEILEKVRANIQQNENIEFKIIDDFL